MKEVALLRLVEGVSGRVGIGIQDAWLLLAASKALMLSLFYPIHRSFPIPIS